MVMQCATKSYVLAFGNLNDLKDLSKVRLTFLARSLFTKKVSIIGH